MVDAPDTVVAVPPGLGEPPPPEGPETPERRRPSAPGRLLIGAVLVVAGALLFVVVGVVCYRAVANPIARSDPNPASLGIRTYFSWGRFMAFTIACVFAAAVLCVGGITLVRHRAVVEGRKPATWSRWAARTSLVFALGLLIWLVGATLAWAVHVGGYLHATRVALPAVVVVLAGLGAIVVVRSLRAEPFHTGLVGIIAMVVVTGLCVAVPYVTAHTVSLGEQMTTSGFHGWAPDSHAYLGLPLAVTCGDREHCLVSGVLEGIYGGDTGSGLATTADGGRTWHAVEVPQLVVGEDSFYCAGAQCVGPVLSLGRRFDVGVLDVHVGRDGTPELTVQRFRSPSAPTASLEGGGCWSTHNCVIAMSTHASMSFSVLWTGDNGRHWATTAVTLPQGFDTPYFSRRPWCTAGGHCLIAVLASRSGCTFNLNHPSSCNRNFLYRSTDGGRSWVPVTTPVSTQGSTVCSAAPVCTSAPVGLGHSFALSTDLGQQWSPPVALGPQLTDQVVCATADRCIVAATPPPGSEWPRAVWQSSDGGHRWQNRYLLPAGQIVGRVGCGTAGPCLAVSEGTDHTTWIAVTGAGGGWIVRSLPPMTKARVTIAG